MKVLDSKECADCGEGTFFHGMARTSIFIDGVIVSIFPPAEKPSFITKLAGLFEEKVGAHILEAIAMTGLAKRQMRPDDVTLLLAKCLWDEADARGIQMYEWRLFGLPRNILVARFPVGKDGRARKIAFEGIPAATYEKDRVWWMDDKARLKKEFMKRELAVARGGAARTEREALSIFRRLTPPVIIKPHSGSGSRHTVLHIIDEAELRRAFAVAKQVSTHAVIEEELVGPVYRATVVDGKFVAALRRDPPHVVGDGVHTIAELVVEANKNPARSGPYFSKIQLWMKGAEKGNESLEFNPVALKELEWQGYTAESVPPKAARVYFHQKVNWSVGGTTADVTDDVHPDNRALFERAARELHAPIVGIDFIIKDISKSYKEQDRTGILECNSMPFFDNHHLPFEGQPRNVAAAIWDMVTPTSSR